MNSSVLFVFYILMKSSLEKVNDRFYYLSCSFLDSVHKVSLSVMK